MRAACAADKMAVTDLSTMHDTPASRFVDIDRGARRIRIEYRLLDAERVERPLLVILHEGLGSVAAWKDFPQRLCEAAGLRGLVYSRYGYGRSTPRPPDEHFGPDYLHREAAEALPALLAALGERAPAWLFGHSDGGSIALIRAATAPASTAGIVVVAPHIDVEAKALAGIRAARVAWATTDLRAKLARYHDDPDSAFGCWNDSWLAPAFAREFDLRGLLPAIRCPVLAVQGEGDEYATLEQVRGIARAVPQAELLELPDCGHSPHRDQPAALLAATAAFVARHGAR
jgi:pimeloyl-ACP methyl ester carboxylesterase